MRRAFLLAGLAVLCGCDEVRRRPVSPPLGLDAGGDPLRGGAEVLVQAFADGGRGLNGKPADMALALARLEFMTDALDRDPALAPISQGIRFQMMTARRQTRDALGMAETVPPASAWAALLATRRALLLGDEAAARAAIDPWVSQGGLPPLARLADMGGLSQASIATANLRDDILRLDLERGWREGPLPSESPFTGVTTTGLGGNTDR
jgi:hypothetical protein